MDCRAEHLSGLRVEFSLAIEQLVFDAVADEAIVMTDTDQHAVRLQPYQRAAGVDTMIEVKPDVGV
jgi:hypothetical protein